jgi:hypothetical protein
MAELFIASVCTLEPVGQVKCLGSVRVGFLCEVNTLNPQSMTQDLGRGGNAVCKSKKRV